MEKQHPTEVADILRTIKKHGDPMDQRRRFGRGALSYLVAHPFALTEGVLAGVAVGTHMPLAYPLMGAAGAVGAGIAYGASRLRERRGAEQADTLQEAVRAQLGEPIDMIRTGTAKERQLTMRWYGTDVSNSARHTMRRLARLNAVAREHDIAQIAFEADWLKGALGDDADLEAYGDVTEGASWMQGMKKSPSRVDDKEAGDELLVATPEQVGELLDAFWSTSDTRLLAQLIDVSGDAQLQAVYDSYLAHPAAGMGDLVRQSHLHLTRSLDEHISDENQVLRDAYGNPSRQRVYRSIHIERDRLNVLGQVHDVQSGVMMQGHEATDLLRLSGAETLDELLELCDVDDEHASSRRRQLATAIYLMIQQEDERQSLYDAHDTVRPIADDVRAGDTFFSRMKDEGVPSFMNAAKTKSRTIEYNTHLSHAFFRGVGAAAVFAAALSASAHATSSAKNLTDGYYDQRVEQCKEAIPSYRVIFDGATTLSREEIDAGIDACDTLFAERQPFESAVMQALYGLTDIESGISTGTLNWLYDTLGPDVLRDIVGEAADSPKYQWMSDALRELPPSYYRNSYDRSFTGDVHLERNQTVYTVTSPSGVSTEGYWYGRIFNVVSMSDRSFNFATSDSAITATREPFQHALIEAPSDQKIRELDKEADLIVTTPYVERSTSSDLPVREGMRIAGVVIMDAQDSSKVVKPRYVGRSHVTGLYSIALGDADADAMWDAGIRTPLLKYWLVKDESITPGSYFSRPMIYPEIYAKPTGNESFARMDEAAMTDARTKLARDTKVALGLAPTATDDEVLNALRLGKTYSLSPLADNGVSINEAVGSTMYEQLGDVARRISQLDSLNCNLASAAYTLATADSMTEVNEAQGFYDNGDGKLTQAEAHAWLVSKRDRIDPTPVRGDSVDVSPSSDEPVSEGSSSFAREVVPTTLAGMAVLGALLVGVRRRRDILQRTLELQVRVATHGKHTGRGMDVIESSLYGSPALRTDRDWATTLPFTDRGTVTERLDRIVPQGGFSPESHQAIQESLTNPTLRPAERRATKRLVRASKQINRQRK